MSEGEVRLLWFVIPALGICALAIGFAFGMGHYGGDRHG